MKSSVSSLGRSAQKIVVRIQKVRKAAEKAGTSKKRFAHYRYLRFALSAYRHFKDNNLLSHLTEIAPSVLRVPVRINSCALRIIVDASCTTRNLKTRSLWVRALRYAVAEKVDPKELTPFMRAHNGIAGCADLASKTKPKRGPRANA